MGGKSSARSSSSTTTNYFDERVTAADNARISNGIIHGDNNVLQITDGGAVSDSLTFAGDVVDAALKFGLQSQKISMDNLAKESSEQLSFLDKSYQTALAAQQSSDERLIKSFMPYLMGSVALIALMSMKK